MTYNSSDTRTYRGRTSSEVLCQIKRDMGADAVIISTRALRDRRNISYVEVVATPATSLSTVHPIVDRGVLRSLGAALSANGVSEELSQRLLGAYRQAARQLDSLDHRLLRSCIAGLVRVRPIAQPPQRTVAFIGPTGVGKTTTAAKMATLDRFAGRKVALITIDTHRIGGVEQLGRYAAHLNAPMVTANTAAELRVAIHQLRAADRIYIDTAGTNFNAPERIAELREILSAAVTAERMLLIPASGNEPDLKRTATAFASLSPHAVGVTKADETWYFGPCFNALHQLRLPLEVFGTGQRVPDDIEEASTAMLLHLLTRVSH
ncbi:MAG: hypothetical protein KDD69_13240 [Bdellovibrionales bacterium]|nr:hypothetical protein [Bdellovibrionales bacterium]